MDWLATFFTFDKTLGYIILITGVLYIFYLIKEKRIAWLFGFISSVGLIVSTFLEKIYMQSILNLLYALMAIYGFIKWSQVDSKNKRKVKISEYSVKNHLILIFVTVLVSGSIATILDIVVQSSYSTLDAFIFAFAILATYMQAHKILSNWLYWIVINALTIVLFVQAQLYSESILMLVYLLLAVWGYRQWRIKLSKQKS
ncbi:MAG: nicotinamide riboside transporter PnuC [Alphaproteobacteria bacterium]|jgi:nicotinamide mononucleotide transporter|nr:nicotinamide riboside transporter PnuC [Alphaproteobacteria bacterium]